MSSTTILTLIAVLGLGLAHSSPSNPLPPPSLLTTVELTRSAEDRATGVNADFDFKPLFPGLKVLSLSGSILIEDVLEGKFALELVLSEFLLPGST